MASSPYRGAHHAAYRGKQAAGVAVAATIGNMIGITATISATFGVFLVPIAEEFGWGRATVSGVLGLVAVVSALAYPFVGKLIDRLGSRPVLITGIAMLGLSVALLALANGSVAQYYAIYTLIGIAGAISGSAMFCKIVADWFDDRRGLMLGVTAGFGNGAGATIMPIVAGVFLTAFGWRGGYLAIGALILLLGVPTLLLLLREAPHRARAIETGQDDATGMTLAEAARTRVFWLMLVAIAAGAGGITAVFTHVVPMLTDRGVDLGFATVVVAVFALTGGGWQIFTGHLLDRMRTPRLIVPMFASAIGGVLLLQFGAGTPVLLLAGLLLGIGIGAEYAALPYFISRYFGMRHYGSIVGATYAVVILVQGITPALMDLGFDRTGSYAGSVIAIALSLAAGILLLALLPNFDEAGAEAGADTGGAMPMPA